MLELDKHIHWKNKSINIIMTGSSPRTSCKPLVQRLELLILSLQYILSLVMFMSQDLEHYTFNSTIHGFNIRNKLQLHKLLTAFTIY